VHSVGEARQIDVRTAEPLVPGPSRLKGESDTPKLKQYKSPGSDQIQSKLIQAGDESLVSAIHKHINSICNKKELSYQFKESIKTPWSDPRANYTDRATAACRRSDCQLLRIEGTI
jgi:hypothetical protein